MNFHQIKNQIFFCVLTLILSPLANAAWWVPILTCDNGAARIEVDLGERRNVQIVITDQNIKNYLSSIGISDFYSSDSIGVRLNNGIFNSSEFTGFVCQGFSAPAYGGYAATVKVYREGRELKLIANQEPAEYCWEQDSIGHCVGNITKVEYKDLGNWYFQSCQEIPILR